MSRGTDPREIVGNLFKAGRIANITLFHQFFSHIAVRFLSQNKVKQKQLLLVLKLKLRYNFWIWGFKFVHFTIVFTLLPTGVRYAEHYGWPHNMEGKQMLLEGGGGDVFKKLYIFLQYFTWTVLCNCLFSLFQLEVNLNLFRYFLVCSPSHLDERN